MVEMITEMLLTLASVVGALLTICGVAILWGAYSRTEAAQQKKSIEATLREFQGEANLAKSTSNRVRQKLETQAHEYVSAQRETRLQTISLDELRKVGVTNVRWGALKGAGVRTVSDVIRTGQSGLEFIEGVGPTSATRIVSAAMQVTQEVSAEPVELPGPDLTEPGAEELICVARQALLARQQLEPVAARLTACTLEISGRLNVLRAKVNFWQWLCAKVARRSQAEASSEWQGIVNEVHNLVESANLSEVCLARKQIDHAFSEKPRTEDLRQDLRRRYADYCAIIESVLGQSNKTMAQTPSRAYKGGVPEEIARRVESFPFSTAGLKVELRGYQIFGAKYLLVQERTLLGDEMGLGKTVQALAAAWHVWSREAGRHFLVITPASITQNWMREIDKCATIRGFALQGSNRNGVFQQWFREGGIAVTSYDTFRLSKDTWMQALQETRIDLLIVDEAHYIKNPATGRTQAVHDVLSRCRRVTFMTGTPLMNHPDEFQHLIELLSPNASTAIKRTNPIVDNFVINPKRFHESVSPIYLRRNKEDVLRELPAKILKEEWVELTNEDVMAYRSAVRQRNYQAMRRVVTIGSCNGNSAKLERLAEILEEYRETGRKVLVFSFFLDVLEQLARRFAPIGKITGALPVRERMQLVDAFNEAGGYQVLISQVEAGGVGLNLHHASVVVLMEPQWNPARENQAIDRAHRMGQTQSVVVHRLLAKDTVDERIYEIIQQKQTLLTPMRATAS